MKILIVGCNNPACRFFNNGECDLPASGRNEHGVWETAHQFDYDHTEGRLICRMPNDEE